MVPIGFRMDGSNKQDPGMSLAKRHVSFGQPFVPRHALPLMAVQGGA